LGAGAPVPETRDELLVATGEAVWRGDLEAAHATLTRLADRERGVADPALDFWSELLALLRCEPLAQVPKAARHDRGSSDPWDGLRRLAQIERVRLTREPRSPATRPIAAGKNGAAGRNPSRDVRNPPRVASEIAGARDATAAPSPSREVRNPPSVPGEIAGHLKTGADDKQVVWPVEGELWSDELPMPAIVNHCVPLEPAQAADGWGLQIREVP